MSAHATTTEVVLPEWSEGMQEAVLIQWLTADGASVATGEPIAEFETDKASTELTAPVDGVLSHREAEGATVAVGGVVALVGPEHVSAAKDPESDGGPPAAAPTEPHAGTMPVAADVETDADAASRRLRASPLARRLAAEHRVDIATLVGSGPRQRIVRVDVEAAIEARPVASAAPVEAPSPVASPVTPAEGGRAGVATSPRGTRSRVEPTRIQRIIARRMVEAKATIPDFAVSTAVEMDDAVALRGQLAAHAARTDGRAPSYNDLVIKASALALREHPLANGSWTDDGFDLHDRVNVGMAVAVDDALVVPTIFDADALSLGAIAGETRRLAGRVREGTVSGAELDGGTFTVSNLGMFGVSHFTAVVNPPQAAILAVGELSCEPVVRGGEIVVGHRMTLTLSCDHRILYGASAAAFLRRIRELLEEPWSLLV